MGREIPIFMAPADRDVLWKQISATGATALAYYHPTNDPVRLSGLADLDQPMVYLVREGDLKSVELTYIATQGHWLVEQINSPVVELSGGRAERGSTCGRLYYVTGRWVGRDWVDLGADFVTWAEGLWAWVRRTFERDRELGCWIGPEARARLSADAQRRTGR